MKKLLIGIVTLVSLTAFAKESVRYSCNDQIYFFNSDTTSMLAFEISGTNKRIKLNQNGRELIFTAEEVQDKLFNSRALVNARNIEHDELDEAEVVQTSSITTRTDSDLIEFKVPTETGWHGVMCTKL